MARTGGTAVPRREFWWIALLAASALALFGVGFVVRIRCGFGLCVSPPLDRLLDLDAPGGLPRSFTTGLFLAVASLAGRRSIAAAGRRSWWWGAVAGGAAVLAVVKGLSVHSEAEDGLSPLVVLAGGLLVAVPTLVVLGRTGRRWGVAATRSVVTALAVYATAALGLDLLGGVAVDVLSSVGVVSGAAITTVEELGEALGALVLLIAVRLAGVRGEGPGQ